MKNIRTLLIISALFLAGCAGTINLSTPEENSAYRDVFTVNHDYETVYRAAYMEISTWRSHPHSANLFHKIKEGHVCLNSFWGGTAMFVRIRALEEDKSEVGIFAQGGFESAGSVFKTELLKKL